MENSELNIQGTEDTPSINFDANKKQFVIEGRSLPEDVTTFYKPVFNWLERYSEKPISPSNFIFKLEYFNTASSKIILDILMKLEDIQNDNKAVINIEWHYMSGDDDMQEAGDEYSELVEVPFNLIEY